MTDWAAIQAGAYSNTTQKAQAIAETILKSKLTRPELESIAFITNLEIMKRKERRDKKKIISLEEYQDRQQHQAQGTEQAAHPEGGEES